MEPRRGLWITLIICGLATMVCIFVERNFISWESTQTIEITDPSQPATFHLHTRSNSVSGIILRGSGELDGDAEIWASNWTPEKLNGVVHLGVYHDWFESDCELHYVPISAQRGHLTIKYEFE